MFRDPLAPESRWRIGLFSKMALVLAPVFGIVAACGLWVLFAHTTVEADNALSTRLGNAAARVASGLERHAKADKSENPWKSPLPTELLNTLLSDQAIRCVIFTRSDAAKTRLIAPRGLGCTGQIIPARFSIPLDTGAASTLEVGYDQSEIQNQRSIWLNLSLLVLGSGLLLSLGAAWLGFRMFITVPLRRLLSAIESIDDAGSVRSVPVEQNDELGTVMKAFNGMQQRDTEKTALLERERARFARVLDSMMDGLLVVDREMRIVMTNSASSRLLGIPKDQIIGASILTLFRSCADRSDDGSSLSSVDALTADGTRIPVLTSVASMRLNDGQATVCVFRDISGVIEREKVLHNRTLEALAASRSKSEFLANMSHELRTPLNAIIGFSEVIATGILGGPKNDANVDYAKDIHDSGNHLLALINDILDIAKVEAGEIKLYPAWVSVREILASVERVMQVQAAHSDVELQIGKPEEDVALHVDALRLKQILINLVSNAIKFTGEDGNVRVETRLEQDKISLSVRDNGVGMTATEVAEAMRPFRQVDNSHTRQYEGTGLGLPLSKSLTELQGGSMEMHSVKGHGTEVVITFSDVQSAAETPPKALERPTLKLAAPA